MKERILYKTLVVGVIAIFISMGVQPAIAKPEIIDFKSENMDRKELTSKINEIMQEYDLKPTEPAFIIISGILFYMMILGFNIMMMIIITIMYFQHY